MAIHWPQILGTGYETVEAMLQDVEFSLQLLIVLLALKLVMTAISLGSGLVGGVFAPAMFLGASLGAAYGKILAAIVPGLSTYMAAPPAYAMVGMAAVLAASAKAPLTAILLLFELTRDYRIVLPLMAAVGLSVWLVELRSPLPSSSNLNLPINLNVEVERIAELLQETLVAEAMYTSPLLLSATLSVLEAGLAMTRDRCRSALVINEAHQLVGIVTLEDINRTLSLCEDIPASSISANAIEAKSQTLLATLKCYTLVSDPNCHLPLLKLVDICTTDILYAYTDEPLADALDRMAARGLHQLPVVERDNHEQVLGLLERDRIALTCSLATTRKALCHHLPVPPTTEKLSLQSC